MFPPRSRAAPVAGQFYRGVAAAPAGWSGARCVMPKPTASSGSWSAAAGGAAPAGGTAADGRPPSNRRGTAATPASSVGGPRQLTLLEALRQAVLPRASGDAGGALGQRAQLHAGSDAHSPSSSGRPASASAPSAARAHGSTAGRPLQQGGDLGGVADQGGEARALPAAPPWSVEQEVKRTTSRTFRALAGNRAPAGSAPVSQPQPQLVQPSTCAARAEPSSPPPGLDLQQQQQQAHALRKAAEARRADQQGIGALLPASRSSAASVHGTDVLGVDQLSGALGRVTLGVAAPPQMRGASSAAAPGAGDPGQRGSSPTVRQRVIRPVPPHVSAAAGAVAARWASTGGGSSISISSSGSGRGGSSAGGSAAAAAPPPAAAAGSQAARPPLDTAWPPAMPVPRTWTAGTAGAAAGADKAAAPVGARRAAAGKKAAAAAAPWQALPEAEREPGGPWYR